MRGRSPLYADLLRACADEPRRRRARRAGSRLGRAAAAARRAALPRARRRGGLGRPARPSTRVPARASSPTQGVQTNEVQRSWVLLPAAPASRAADRARRRSTSSSSGRARGSISSGIATATATRPGSGGARTRCSASTARSGGRCPGELLELERWRCAGGSGSTARRSTSRPRTARGCCAPSSGPARTSACERLDRAIEALRDDPPELVRGDYVEELPEVLDGAAGAMR